MQEPSSSRYNLTVVQHPGPTVEVADHGQTVEVVHTAGNALPLETGVVGQDHVQDRRVIPEGEYCAF